MSDNEDDALSIDLTNYQEPDDVAAAWAVILSDLQDDPTAEVVLDEPDEQIELPADFDSWTDDQRESWAWDSDLLRYESSARRGLYGAWLKVHPEADILNKNRSDREHDNHAKRSLFVDIGALLQNGLTATAADGGAPRTDGALILYRGRVNAIFGDPESAKTLYSLVVLASELNGGGIAAFVDTDHNGVEFILGFLTAIGVQPEALTSRLYYAEPDDRDELVEIIDAIADLGPSAVVLDSVGENLSIWGVSANDDQGVIDLNRATAAKLAKAGHLVLTIDHQAKNTDSRRYGATGSTAKKRAVNGAAYEVVVVDEFSPTDGGKSALILRKDRFGGVRRLGYKRGETVAVFELTMPDSATGIQDWMLHPGTPTSSAAAVAVQAAGKLAADVAALAQLNPPPKSKDDVRVRMKWGTARALAAMNAWRAQTPGSQP